MARKRVKISHNIQREIRQVSERKRRTSPYRLAQFDENVEAEGDVTKIQESERFMQEGDNATDDFIPLSYNPTKTSWPANGFDHRRTIAAGYNRNTGILRVEFWTDGAIYDYGVITPVPPYIAYQFRLAQSPGRYINSTLESYGYTRIN